MATSYTPLLGDIHVAVVSVISHDPLLADRLRTHASPLRYHLRYRGNASKRPRATELAGETRQRALSRQGPRLIAVAGPDRV